ncbi:hypothetical protein GCM10027515_11110 [Schumannella luteola]
MNDKFALALAVIGALLAAISLGWQIATWHLDGRRVRLRLLHGARDHSATLHGAVKRDRQPIDLSRAIVPGFNGREVVGVSVTNVGRAPVRIDAYSVHVEGAPVALTFNASRALGPDLPMRIPPGESESWFAFTSDLRPLMTTSKRSRRRDTRRVWLSVELGTGDSKTTRCSIELAALRSA